jgi:hypothetical protein
MVDDQFQTFSVEELQSLKRKHEKWVSAILTEQQRVPDVRVRRIKENIPTHLLRLTSGRAVLAAVAGFCAGDFEHDELKSELEVELVSRFLQGVQDYGELWDDLEAGDRVKADFEIGTQLNELEQAGFWVFGGREVQRLEGGLGSPTAWPVAIIRVLRGSSSEIIKVNLKEDAQQCPESLTENSTFAKQ